jgi:alcohol dehydrogenase
MLKSGIYFQQSPVLFGTGTHKQAGEKAKELGMTKVMLVTDKGVKEAGHADKVAAFLREAGIEVIMWDGALQDCPENTVREAAKICRESKVDGIVGVGGGSVLDTAKAVAAVVPNGDDVLDDIALYITGQKQYANPRLKQLLIPTTAGTGSESTFVSVVTSIKNDGKVGLPSPSDYAIVDPELTLGCPAYITAYTGLDAFSHANEALTEKKNNPHSDLLAYEAIRLITKWLPVAVNDINNLEARENLAFASNIAGISFNESGVHIGHALAHQLGHIYDLPHGVCCALFTPAVIEFAAKTYPEKVKRIGEAMGIEVKSEKPEEIGKIVADEVRKLVREVKIPTFKELGLTKEQVLELAPVAFNWPDPLCHAFAGETTLEDVYSILEVAYDNY